MSEFACRIAKIDDVRPHGDNLSIVTVMGHEVVANRREDGSFRWQAGEACVYVPEGAIVPKDVLRERGYWDEARGKGMLEGKKGNRVKMRRFAGHESRGLLFKVMDQGDNWTDEQREKPYFVLREGVNPDTINVDAGECVADFLGITEHLPG